MTDRNAIAASSASAAELDQPLAPKRTRLEEFWRLFRRNRLAILGMAIFVIFFIVAVIGLVLTSGTEPLLDPAVVRLQEKLRPPLTRPHLESLRPEEAHNARNNVSGKSDERHVMPFGRDIGMDDEGGAYDQSGDDHSKSEPVTGSVQGGEQGI